MNIREETNYGNMIIFPIVSIVGHIRYTGNKKNMKISSCQLSPNTPSNRMLTEGKKKWDRWCIRYVVSKHPAGADTEFGEIWQI